MKEIPSQLEFSMLQRILKNDEQALVLLMRKYYSDLYNYASRFTADGNLIKDCIQEVFISLWQRRQTAGTILSPKCYFLRAIKDKVLNSTDKLRGKAGPRQITEDEHSCYGPSMKKMIIAKLLSEENTIGLRDIPEFLSTNEKEVIYLKCYQYLNNSQIAELMSVSRQMVDTLLHGAVRKLTGVKTARVEFLKINRR